MVVREEQVDKATSSKRCEGSEGASHVDVWGKNLPIWEKHEGPGWEYVWCVWGWAQRLVNCGKVNKTERHRRRSRKKWLANHLGPCSLLWGLCPFLWVMSWCISGQRSGHSPFTSLHWLLHWLWGRGEQGQKWAVTQTGREGNFTGLVALQVMGEVNRFCLHFEFKPIGVLTDLTSIMRERGFLSGSVVKNPPAMQEMRLWSLGWEDPLRRAWKPTPVFLPGESHGQRSLVGCSIQGCKESGTTEVTEHACVHMSEGGGEDPAQVSAFHWFQSHMKLPSLWSNLVKWFNDSNWINDSN